MVQNLKLGLEFKDVLILTFGQIKGATTLSFGFLLANNKMIPEGDKTVVTLFIQFIFYISGVAFLSLIFNPFIVKFLHKFLKINETHAIKHKVYYQFLKDFHESTEQKVEEIKR